MVQLLVFSGIPNSLDAEYVDSFVKISQLISDKYRWDFAL